MTVAITIVLCLAFLAMLSILWSTIRHGISPMPSNRASRQAMLSLLPSPPTHSIIDLGSGWGSLAFDVASKHPKSKIIGYELSLLPYWYSKIRYRRENLSFHRRNFMLQQYPDDVLFLCYLYPGGMEKVRDLVSGRRCIVISNTFALPSHKATDSCKAADIYKSPIYLYELKAET